MIINNANEVIQKNFHTIIIGSGPAGITLALKLEKKKIPVLIVEAGSRYPTDVSQGFYKGKTRGDNYPDLSVSRLRQLGGTSGHWGGTCSVMNEYDFETWPIKKKDINIYETEARKILDLVGNFSEKKISNNLNYIGTLRSNVNFGEKYYSHIEKSPFIYLVLNSTFLKFNIRNNTVSGINVDFKNSVQKISSKNYVLACGALENSRLMLWSRHDNQNHFDYKMPIGHYYMDHPTTNAGEGVLNIDKFYKYLQKYKFTTNVENRCDSFYFFSPNKNFLRSKKILNTRAGIYFKTLKHDEYTRRILRKITCAAPNFVKHYLTKADDIIDFTIETQSDQEPLYENKVSLDSSATDEFGIPRINLFWKRSKLVRDSARITMVELGKFFIDHNIGRIGVENFLFTDKEYLHTGGYHHMGGTRMGDDKKDSVVDKNLKVHNINNLYICGSSVFKSAGSANPTFTIVQLSLKLGDHIANQG